MFKNTFLFTLFLFIAAQMCYPRDTQRSGQIESFKEHKELQKQKPLQIQKQKELSANAKQSLEARGFRVLGPAPKLVSPRRDSLAKDNDVVRVAVSFDLSKSGIKPIYMGTPIQKRMSSSTYSDTIMTDGFEGDFPGTQWQRTGDPTWGKTNYRKHNGNYSIWCAKDGIKGVQPGQSYPNNCQSMIIYGPFDLTNVNYAQLNFWYSLDTEYEKDWFHYMVSTDGNNFQGLGVSGETIVPNEMLHLSNIPGLGNATGHSQVWIAFLFESDVNATSDKGVFVDDVILTKRQISGTPIAGFLNGTITSLGNPYIAVGDVGILKGDSLQIDPGVKIHFEQSCEFNVFGSLKAIGTPSDSILFTSNKMNPSPGDWAGIGLYSSAEGNSRLQYCRVEYAGLGDKDGSAGIYADNTEISNCLIQYNKNAGIFTEDRVDIKNNKIILNDFGIKSFNSSYIKVCGNIIAQNETGIEAVYTYGSNLFVYDNIIENNENEGVSGAATDLVIVKNIIRNNGSDGIFNGGAAYYMTTDLIAVRNIIENNNGCGIRIDAWAARGNIEQNVIARNEMDGFKSSISFFDPYVILCNNTIFDNQGCGINFGDGTLSYSYMVNNIVAGNGSSGLKSGSSQFFHISYNNLFDNNPNFNVTFSESLGNLNSTNMKGTKCDSYFNISENPLFVDLIQNNLQLLENSPCKNSGDHCAVFNNLDGQPNDMGAFGGSGLFISSAQYDYGNLVIGTNKEADIQLVNNRDQDFIIDTLHLTDEINFSISSTSKIQISPYQSTKISVYFQAKTIGDFSTTLTLNSNQFFGGYLAQIPLNGRGINGTIIQSSTVSGIWTKSNSPYIVKECLIPKGSKLSIEPGVNVLMEESKYIHVLGSLVAVGTAQDSIIFTPYSLGTTSGGLQFYEEHDESKVEYCCIEHVGGSGAANAILAAGKGNLIIRHNTIQLGEVAIDCWNHSSPQIIHNTIRNNNATYGHGGAIQIEQGSSALIENNIIYNNRCFIGQGGGIYLADSAKVINNIIVNNYAAMGGGIGFWEAYRTSIIENNIIANNTAYGEYGYGGGIYFHGGRAILNNNTIVSNIANVGGGIYSAYSGSDIVIQNSIVYSNQAPNSSQIGGSWFKLNVKFSNIQGDWQGEVNIDSDPLFLDPGIGNYHLQPNSPCIDKGNPDPQYNDSEDQNKLGYALYPGLGTIRNDIGAYGGPGATNLEITTSVSESKEIANLPKEIELFQNYPNPFNSVTNIKYQLPKNTKISIKVYNISGQLVQTVVDAKKDAGNYVVIWNGLDNKGRRIASGIYIYRLKTKDFIKTRKMIFIQ